MLVSAPHLSTAYGIVTSAINLSITAVPLIVAPIVNSDLTYHNCGLFFTLLAVLSFVLVMILSKYNRKRHLGLNSRVDKMDARDSVSNFNRENLGMACSKLFWATSFFC